MEDARKAELLERHLNNAAIYTSNENFDEAFATYLEVTKENPDELSAWIAWLSCCYQRIESERCFFCKEGQYDIRTMKGIFGRVLALCPVEDREAHINTWNTFWINTADSAWAGEMSLFSVPISELAHTGSFVRFARDLAYAGEMHQHVADVIAEGVSLAEQLNEAGVCFWQVDHLTIAPRERVFQMEREVKAGQPLKGTFYDWFLSRPEFGTKLSLVLGKMCLSRLEAPETGHGEKQPDSGLLVFLVRAIPMEDIKVKEFHRYATWRWNAMKYCPHCGTRLVGLFTRSCLGCNRDVKKMKKR